MSTSVYMLSWWMSIEVSTCVVQTHAWEYIDDVRPVAVAADIEVQLARLADQGQIKDSQLTMQDNGSDWLPVDWWVRAVD
jgi:hypothetical protein